MKNIKKILCCFLLVVCCSLFFGVTRDMDVIADNSIVLADGNFTVNNAEYEIVEETYSGSGNGVQMKLSTNKAGIYFTMDELQGFEIGEEVIVDFRIYTSGSGYDGKFTLYKAGGEIIDYGFLAKTWNRVRFRTYVFQNADGVKNVYVAMEGGKSKTVTISDLSIVKAPEKTKLLGGVKLYQMDAKSNLMQSYVLQTQDGKVIVMDGGDTADANNLLEFVRTLTNEVDYWFLSHYHSDHVKALHTILKYNATIKIKNLYYDFPTTETAKTLSGDGDSYLCDEIDSFVEKNRAVIENVITPKRGDVIEVSEGVKVTVLNDAYFEKNNNYGNNTTVVYKVTTPGEDILFLGDLGDRGDAYLEDQWFVEEAEVCTIIQLAHHGQNGTTDKFYKMIKEKKVVLYAALQWIYDNSNGSGFNTANLTTLHMRDLVREWGVMDIYTQARGRTLIE